MASYDTGYDDERFQHPVGHTLHCGICLNVLKDPVTCRHNEHLFCRACITIHLMNFQTCPSCMEPLTVESLRQAPRSITNLLSELKIRCQFFDRGCGQFVELGNLERHVADCGFAPAVCSNEGCQVEVNKHDLLHHETAVCELRRVNCHSCNEIKQEMDTVKVNLAAMNEKLKGVGEAMDRNQENVVAKVELVQEQLRRQLKQEEGNRRLESAAMNEKLKGVGEAMDRNQKNVVAKVELVQEQLRRQLNKQEEGIKRLEADNVEIKRSLNEITKQLERMTGQTSHKVQEKKKKKFKGFALNASLGTVAGGFKTRKRDRYRRNADVSPGASAGIPVYHYELDEEPDGVHYTYDTVNNPGASGSKSKPPVNTTPDVYAAVDKKNREGKPLYATLDSLALEQADNSKKKRDEERAGQTEYTSIDFAKIGKADQE